MSKNLRIRTYDFDQVGPPAGVVFAAAADRIMIPRRRWMVVDLVAAAAAVVEYQMTRKRLAV